MNYIIAFCIILLGTIFWELTGGKDTYWLLVSDGNVAIALILAWILDKKKPIIFNITLNKGNP